MTGMILLSLRAQRDLETIWDDTASRWGVAQAEQYARQLWQHMSILADNPAMGRACPEIRDGYYKYPSGSHLLFYRLAGGDIDIVRILHVRMNWDQHF
jgi:toxin ParE1/3/4